MIIARDNKTTITAPITTTAVRFPEPHTVAFEDHDGGLLVVTPTKKDVFVEAPGRLPRAIRLR